MQKIIDLLRSGFALSAMAASLMGTLPCVAQETLPQEVTNAIRQEFGDDELRYLDGSADLNGDGKAEVVVFLVGNTVCGSSGCNLLVFTPSASGYKRVADMTVTNPPIRVASAVTSGWKSLIVHVGGGGIESEDVELAFDGRAYPSNPTVSGPRVKPAKNMQDAAMLIDDFQSFEDTKLLPTGTGPSFDCAKAQTSVEKLICGDTELAALDLTLAGVYTQALASASAEAKREKSTAQKVWLSERNQCAKASDMKACVLEAYQRRIEKLQSE